ncbi:MAG TPA: RNA polymerase subunit sigma-70 [Armatimonadetes bacterium]|nr:sigma-70 family RNA polymerase sigma factor [Armatimonadota bacterium]MCA1997977.1 sigma-70 family RNA polymerase sigma factor [Armatimonadota bacterium]HCE01309.1 RNA polymerase subunit sigma-70 [Armatimonadota bacterium]
MAFAIARDGNVARALDREHFERLLKESYRQAYALAYRLTGNAADAEDLLQDAAIRAYRFFHQYDPELPFGKWLAKILCNANVDRIRRRGRLRTTSLDQPSEAGGHVPEVADWNSLPDRAMVEESVSDPLQEGLAAVRPEFRTAVVLADIEGMEYEEIAQTMGTSVGTVRSRIHRGRKQLRRYLLEKFPDFVARMVDEL